MRKRSRKRIGLTERVPLLLPETSNHAWSMDFVHDGLADGRRIRCLNIVDDYTKESAAIEVDTSMAGQRVARVLNRIAEYRPLPKMIRVDHGARIHQPGIGCVGACPRREARIHSTRQAYEKCLYREFQRALRDECLNDHWFSTLHETCFLIEAWRKDYNLKRRHSSLGYVTPIKFVAQHQFVNQDSTALFKS